MEAGSPPAAPADPFDEFFPQQHGCGSDADDASPSASNYSSCDGEDSELERYCSANSALGSASLCSSVGNYADLLDFSDVCGAIENSQRGRLGGDIAASWDRFNRYSEEGAVTSPRENCSSPSQHLLALSDRMGSLPRISTGSRLRPASVDRPGESTQLRVVEDQQEAVPCNGKEVDFLDRDVISMGRDDGYSDQSSLLCAMAGAEEVGSLGNLGSSSRDVMMESDEDRPSRCEHSDGEDSMLEYGTDCENANGLSENLRCIDETKHDNLNPLLMNSSVAYGSDDLDELMRENGGLSLQSLSLYQDQPNFQQTVPAKGDGHLPLLSNSHVIDPLHDVEKDEDAVDVSAVNHKFQVTDQPNSELSHKGKFLLGEYTLEDQIKSMYKGLKGDFYSISDGIVADVHVDEAPERQVFGEPASADTDTVIKISSISVGTSRHEKCFGQDYDKPSLLLPVVHSGQSSSFQIELDGSLNFTDLSEENIVTDEIQKQDSGDVYDEMVLEMEEILLDTGSGTRPVVNHQYLNHQSHHFRDGSSTASTSGTDDINPPPQFPSSIDWVEVIGAKQKIGDVSFGERLVGVKQYTVYILRVWSAKDQWEVERRYRNFFALYQQLKTLFSDHDLSLPSQWSFVERESMKIFGNASPIVVSNRSALIQECLRSVLNSRYPFGFPSPLLCFLSPGKVAINSNLLKALVPQSFIKFGEGWNSKFSTYKESPENISELGKTIPLIVSIKPQKSMQKLLELQHYTCAGCHKHLDAGKTLLRDLVQTLGWKRPRFCEYSGQLFCATCHTNDTSVLPAKILHLWDFSLYPVSQLAKAYLDSIYDQPMLCVSAINPFLFSKVPALLHVMGIRKNIGAMFPYIRCPFRISIQRGFRSRCHLLESNDFFALRDLVDLSKGAFAALPVMLETVSNKILEHITQQCLVCYDTGVPCAARQICDEPLSLIFPFQEAEAARCNSCGSIFHQPCFVKMICCTCGKSTNAVENLDIRGHGESEKPLAVLAQPSKSSPSLSLFSNILLKASPDLIRKPKDRSPAIFMGSLSLSNTSLY
ncbi:uncharacterized protein LOC103974793 isoform X1 [Musa acuminata AAA Group]|uniref:uncharacterized protein LOC103974793 isoform X1 n=1 Tax=Musa acuminata AAA Group TaxID=214697 RepID=UPI0031D279F6